MQDYEIEIYRDGHWWMIRIPELEGLTQPALVTSLSACRSVTAGVGQRS